MQTNDSYTESDFYLSYLEHTGGVGQYNISKKIFRLILKDYFLDMSTRIILRASEIKLPSGMGLVYVKKKKPIRYDNKSMRIDFGSTRKENKTIMHLNEHSDGYNYMFKWSKRTMFHRSKSLYELVMSRTNKRLLAKCIKEKITDYIEE